MQEKPHEGIIIAKCVVILVFFRGGALGNFTGKLCIEKEAVRADQCPSA